MSARSWPWDVLDLPQPPGTTAEVRRAYAKKLKTIDQAKDIAGFEALREAYEAALARIEYKARHVAQPAAQSPPMQDVTFVPDIATDPPVTVPVLPPVQSAGIAASEAPPLSVEDRLAARLQGLTERNILVSATDRARHILDEPDFQAPELDSQLRAGFADYLRSQLLFNHLNEPYLRHPGVTADLLRALDARFHWVSDYSAFRRDFHGDPHLLEAVLDAAGIDRTPPPRTVTYFSLSQAIIAHLRLNRTLYIFGGLAVCPFLAAGMFADSSFGDDTSAKDILTLLFIVVPVPVLFLAAIWMVLRDLGATDYISVRFRRFFRRHRK
jgi:hypothetical protein